MVGSLKAGYGKSDITPPLGVELAGYGYYLKRKAERVRDPLYARAVALSQGEKKSLIVSCDLLGLNDSIVQQVRQAAGLLGVDPDKVILVSIHTHSGPATIYHLGCGEVSESYVEGLGKRIIAACKAAIDDLAPVDWAGSALSPLKESYAYNRAIHDGPVDLMVRGLLLKRNPKQDIALVSYACHSVFLGRNTSVSADYSSEIHRLFAEEGRLSVFLNGLCGDIDPLPQQECGREEQMQLFARAIFEAFHINLIPETHRLQTGSLPCFLKTLQMSKEEIHAFADQAVSNSGHTKPHLARNIRLWEQEVLQKDPLPAGEALRLPFAILGNTCIIAFPFEGYTGMGELIRRYSGSERVITLGCSDQLLGYLPTLEDQGGGSYGALESAFLYQRMPPLSGEAERLGKAIGILLKSEMEKNTHG